jgi:hypothetical protein
MHNVRVVSRIRVPSRDLQSDPSCSLTTRSIPATNRHSAAANPRHFGRTSGVPAFLVDDARFKSVRPSGSLRLRCQAFSKSKLLHLRSRLHKTPTPAAALPPWLTLSRTNVLFWALLRSLLPARLRAPTSPSALRANNISQTSNRTFKRLNPSPSTSFPPSPTRSPSRD